MITTSGARWQNGVRSSGRRICLVDLYYNRQPLPVLQNLKVVSGSITADAGAANRRSGTITLANTDLLTTDPSLSLEPYGLELGVKWGVTYPNGDEETIRMGMYQFTNTEWQDDQGSIPTLNLTDRSGWFAEQSSQNGFYDYGGVTHIAAIQDLLGKGVFTLVSTSGSRVDPDTLSTSQIHLVVDPASTAKDFKIPGGSPSTGTYWDNITTFANNINSQIYFAEDGVNVILRPVDTLDTTTTAYTATLRTGNYGDIMTAARSLSRANVWNAVSATGVLPANAASAETPPYVFVYDNNPASKTYYNGPFGKITAVLTNETITTKVALQAWAEQQLAKGLGLSRSVSLGCLGNGAIEPGDIVQVSFVSGEVQLHQVQSMELDLFSSLMSVTTLSQNQV